MSRLCCSAASHRPIVQHDVQKIPCFVRASLGVPHRSARTAVVAHGKRRMVDGMKISDQQAKQGADDVLAMKDPMENNKYDLYDTPTPSPDAITTSELTAEQLEAMQPMKMYPELAPYMKTMYDHFDEVQKERESFEVPKFMKPRNRREKMKLDMMLRAKNDYFIKWQAADLEDQAYQAVSRMKPKEVNKFLPVARLSNVMQAFEKEDYRRGEKRIPHLIAYARAELVSEVEFDRYNEAMKVHVTQHKAWDVVELDNMTYDVLEKVYLDNPEAVKDSPYKERLKRNAGTPRKDADELFEIPTKEMMDNGLALESYLNVFPGVSMSDDPMKDFGKDSDVTDEYYDESVDVIEGVEEAEEKKPAKATKKRAYKKKTEES